MSDETEEPKSPAELLREGLRSMSPDDRSTVSPEPAPEPASVSPQHVAHDSSPLHEPATAGRWVNITITLAVIAILFGVGVLIATRS